MYTNNGGTVLRREYIAAKPVDYSTKHQGAGNSYKSVEVFAPSHLDEIVLDVATNKDFHEALSNETFMDELLNNNARVYSGGDVIAMPLVLHSILGQIYHSKTLDEETLVLEITSKNVLPCGAPISAVTGRGMLSGKIVYEHVIPEGFRVESYALSSTGIYKLEHGHEVTTLSRYVNFNITPGLPTKPRNGLFKEIRYKWRKMKHSLYNLTHCSEDYSHTYVIDRYTFNYLHQQRLGTSSSLETAAVERVLESAAIKKSVGCVRPLTLRTTIGYFSYFFNHKQNAIPTESCIIMDKTTFPALFESSIDFAFQHVGVGFFHSSEPLVANIQVVNNGNLEEKSSRGVTFSADGKIKFTTPFTLPNSLYFYGGHPASDGVKSTVKSTRNLEQAFLRMSNSRVREKDFRKQVDFLLMTYFGHGAGRVDPHIRRLCVRYNAFSDWGLPHTDYRSYYRKESPFRLQCCTKILSLLRSFLNSLDVTARSDQFSHKILEVNTVNYIEKKIEFANREHDKKKERQATVTSQLASPYTMDPPPIDKANDGKIKWENGKYGKLQRMFINMGNDRTLQEPLIPEIAKEIMSVGHPLVWINDGITYFVHLNFYKAPDASVMDAWASELWEEEGPRPYLHPNGVQQSVTHVFFNYHSDDSHLCSVVRIAGKMYRMNLCVDISKCDLSHSPGIFILLIHLLERLGFSTDLILPLFDQLMADIRIIHPNRKEDEYIIFVVKYILLTSGWTGTTLINNLGSVLIGLSIIVHTLCQNFSDVDHLKRFIFQSAEFVGYEVTIDALVLLPIDVYIHDGVGDPIVGENNFIALRDNYKEQHYPKLTFLKNFPVLSTSGQPVAFRDLATLIRSLGISDEEVDGLTRLREVVSGWKFSYDCDLLDTIFESVGLVKDVTPHRIKYDFFEYRYACTIQSLTESLSVLFTCRTAMLIAHPALDSILKVGYDLPRLRVEVSEATEIYCGTENDADGPGIR